MSGAEPILLRSGQIHLELPALRVPFSDESRDAGPDISDVPERCRQALSQPHGYPDLAQCVFPGDRIVIVPDLETPKIDEILVAVLEYLTAAIRNSLDVIVLLPPDPSDSDWQSFRNTIPLEIQQQISVRVHQPADTSQLSYVASSSGGERIYVNRLLADADTMITIGMIGFDGLLGYKGTSSILYPTYGGSDAQHLAGRQGHPELTPDQQRPFRELVDEVGWLLGTQFTVQVIPGLDGQPQDILAGLPEDVMNPGRKLADSRWRVRIAETLAGVVLSIPGGSSFGWSQLGQALERVTAIVQQGGRIVVIADVDIPEGPAAGMLRRCQDPEELLKPLRREPTADSVEITQLIQALRRARVYLHSRLPADVVEELGMIPVADQSELLRLIATIDDLCVIPYANYSWCEVEGVTCV